jgi:hypothetical protein
MRGDAWRGDADGKQQRRKKCSEEPMGGVEASQLGSEVLLVGVHDQPVLAPTGHASVDFGGD